MKPPMAKQNGQKLFDAVMAAQRQMPPRKRKRPSRNALRVPPRPTGATVNGAVSSTDRVGY